ncbi:MAG TPA: (d)CMP kinase [Thermoflexia bacterium]|nr:(d)CMP kinase [Thermoflexia bacterium]
MCIPATIAIDGPAASGKSTIGYHLARKLNYLYLDTGILYRAVTWAALERDISITDADAVVALASHLDIQVLPPDKADGRQATIQVDGADVTWELRTPAVDKAVSPISTYPAVRRILTAQMRQIGQSGRVVMVGRDIGTVVLPHAELKLYVVATAEERAHRRQLERQAQGKTTSYEQMLAEIRRRDQIDSHRKSAPLRAAADAIHFNNTQMSIPEMFRAVEELVIGE